jgi:hypothetical protein
LEASTLADAKDFLLNEELKIKASEFHHLLDSEKLIERTAFGHVDFRGTIDY